METNTAAQRSAAATPGSPAPPQLVTPSQPNRPEVEYGCVDWFPYASVRDERGEWLEHQESTLAAGIA